MQLLEFIKFRCQHLLVSAACGEQLASNVAQAMGAEPLRAFLASFIVPPGPAQAVGCASIATLAERALASAVVFPQHSLPMLVLREQDWLYGFAPAACMGIEAASGVAVMRTRLQGAGTPRAQAEQALPMVRPFLLDAAPPRFGSTLHMVLDARDRTQIAKPHFRQMAEAVLAEARVAVPVGELGAVLACMGFDEAAAAPLAACMHFAKHRCDNMEVRPLRVQLGAQELELMAIVLPYTVNQSCHQYDNDRDGGRLLAWSNRRNVMFLPEQATLQDTALCSRKQNQQFYPFAGEERTTVALLCFNYTSTTETKCCMSRMVPSDGVLTRVTETKGVAVSRTPNTPRPARLRGAARAAPIEGGLAAACDAMQAAMRAVQYGTRRIDSACTQQLIEFAQQLCMAAGVQPQECAPSELSYMCSEMGPGVENCARMLADVMQELRRRI